MISTERKKEWYSNRHDEKDYFTTAGKITFTKTLYTNKKTGESRYLIDDVLGIDPYERLSDNTKVKIIDEATQTSYRKAGEVASATDNVSKSAVKDLMHSLQFPEDTFEDVEKKRWVPVLWYFFNPFVNINKFWNYAVVFSSMLSSLKVSFFIFKLQFLVVFISFNIQNRNSSFLLNIFKSVFLELTLMRGCRTTQK